MTYRSLFCYFGLWGEPVFSTARTALIAAMAGAGVSIADSQDSSGEWEMVAYEEVGKMATLEKQMEEAAEDYSDSEAGEGDDHEVGAVSAAERVRRFSAAASPVSGDEPYWLETFHNITEALDMRMTATADNWQKPLHLISGCSGLLAEAWVCKAGPGLLRDWPANSFLLSAFVTRSFGFP